MLGENRHERRTQCVLEYVLGRKTWHCWREQAYDYVEWGIASHLKPEQPEEAIMPPLRAALADSRLLPETFNLLLPGDLKVVGPETDPARQERYLETAFRRAQAVGGRLAVFGSGGARGIPSGFSPDEAHAQVIAFLRLCGPAAARHGMEVAIEPLNRTECNHINSVTEGSALAQEVGHPAVGVLSDLYHVTQEEQSYEETRQAAPWLRHVHVAGAQDRRAPVAEDRAFLRPYFAVLKESGYAGRISIEGTWSDLPAQASAALDVLRQAWDEA